MRLVRQKRGTDCGVAALAMLAGVTYHAAKVALFGPGRRRSFRTLPHEMRAAALKFGVVLSLRRRRCVHPERLTRDALIWARSSGDFHWVVWDNGRQQVLDPLGRGRKSQPISCLLVRRRMMAAPAKLALTGTRTVS